MNRLVAERLAKKLLEEFDCVGWNFRWINSRRVLAYVNVVKNPKTGNSESILCLSRQYVDLNNRKEVEDTILHEIAHIKAGLHNNHNAKWRRWCRMIGADPRPTSDTAVMPEPKYLLICTICKCLHIKRHRRSLKLTRRYCIRCGPQSVGRLAWVKNPAASDF